MDFIKLIVTGLGLGLLPIAPGTWGTLLGIPLAILFSYFGAYGYMFATIIVSVGGMVASEIYERRMQSHDNSEIVIDEVAGFLVTMTWLPMTWQSLLLGFFVFRVLDVIKPFPISYVDERVKGGVGVVADDLLAGLVGNILLQVVYANTNILGAQLAP